LGVSNNEDPCVFRCESLPLVDFARDSNERSHSITEFELQPLWGASHRKHDYPIAKAYLAPENIDEPIRYSGHVEQPDGSFEFPQLRIASGSSGLARERTDFVIGREVAGEYLWYGIGPSPHGLTVPPE